MQKVTFGLIGLNLVLAGYLAVALTQRPPQPTAAPIEAAPQGESAANPTRAQQLKSAPAPAPAKFTWDSIASRDLRRYAANLRQVGCPEQTVKEILSAEVNRIYGLQERALKVRADDIAPWEKQALYDRRGGETKLRQLLEEKRSLLRELTGVDVGIDMPSRLAGRDLGKFEGAFTSLPEDRRDAVRAIQENYWAQSDDIKQRTMGYLEPEDRDEFQRIKTERKEALAKILSPEELLDYEMKTSDVTASLKSRMQGFEITDDEFKKVFGFAQPLDDQYSISRRKPDPEDQDFTAARTQAEKSLEDQIHAVLGDERYAEYQRTRDPVYRGINQAGTEAGLPKESILQAYQAQQEMQAETKRIMQDASLTPEQRAQSLQGMRTQAQQTFQQLFGDKGAQMIQRLPAGRLADRYGITVETLPVLTQPVVDHP